MIYICTIFIIQMGAKQTLNNQISILSDGQHWKITQKGPLTSKWTHQLTHDLATQHFLSFNDQAQSQQEMRLYDYRKNSPNFVRALFFEVIRDQIACYTSIRCKVLIQVIRYRLDSLSLSDEEILYVFFECLLGFQQLYNRFGYIEIDKDMIGINMQGKVKVWLNKTYLKNHKEQDSGIIQQSLLRRQKNLQVNMIRKLIRILNKVTSKNLLSQNEFSGNFKEVINHFNLIIQNRQLVLAKKINSINIQTNNQQIQKKIPATTQNNHFISQQRKKYDFKERTVHSNSVIKRQQLLNTYKQQGRPLKIVIEQNLENEGINNILSTKSNILTPKVGYRSHNFI